MTQMVQIQINDDHYQVDLAPLKERGLEQLTSLIAEKREEHPLLIQGVKGVCEMVIRSLGEDKPRNVNAIDFMAEKVIELTVAALLKNGIVLQGEKLEPQVIEQTGGVSDEPTGS